VLPLSEQLDLSNYTLIASLTVALTVDTVPISIVDRSIITARMTETVLLPK
jgi:hypothetical protein